MSRSSIPLADVADLIMGQSPPSTTYSSKAEGLPFFQGKTDFGDVYPQPRMYCTAPVRVAEAGDILISVRAPVGPTNVALERCCLGRGLAAIRPRNAVLDRDYLLFFLRQHEPRLAALGQGSTFEAINRDDLENVEVPFPSLTEQRRIAAQLEQADRLRRTRRYTLALSDTFLPATFRRMFGDTRLNPNQYSLVHLAELCTKFSDGPFGSNLKSAHYTAKGVRVIRLQNIGVGEFDDSDSAYIAEEHFDQLKKHRCEPGDVLIGTLGEPNLRACFQPDHIALALNKADCIQAKPDLNKADPNWFCWLLNMPSTLLLAPGMIHGQTRSRISMGELAELPVPVPPLSQQRAFAAVVREHERLRAVQRESLRQAEHLFQTLLHRAFAPA